MADPDYDLQRNPTLTRSASEGNDQRNPTLTRSASEGKDQRRSTDLAKQGIHFKQLPGFAREADAIAAAWKRVNPKEPLDPIRREGANEERLAQVKRPKLLYFITHGFFLPDLEVLLPKTGLRDFELVPFGGGGSIAPRPTGSKEDPRLRSGLALAGANNWKARSERGQSDGLLTAYEVQQLDLWGTELVVLSACETGLGEVHIGEGVLGLRRAFQLAGAKTVLASLWKVPDAETEKLMSRFFELWLSGKPKAEALRQAQMELIDALRKSGDAKRKQAPPLFWAGFICHGLPD